MFLFKLTKFFTSKFINESKSLTMSDQIIQANESNKREWWKKAGFGIMYQIGARPSWIWDCNWDKFNASMRNDKGEFEFNGPFCKMEDWVKFSKEVGVD